jgi:hypothetical protein
MTEERTALWHQILQFMTENFGKKPDMNAILFIIGMRELGFLGESNFKKTTKYL